MRRPKERVRRPDLTLKQLWSKGGDSLTLSIEEFTLEDQNLLRQARDPNHVTAAHRTFHPLAPESWNKYLDQVALILGILRIIEPSAMDEPLSTRLTPDRVLLIIDFLSCKRSYHDCGLEMVVHGLRLGLARMAPDADLSWLADLERRYRRTALHRDVSALLKSPEEFFELGRTLMSEARVALAAKPLPRAASLAFVKYRDGLMICVNVDVALRRRDMTNLTIGNSYEPTGVEHLIKMVAHKNRARIWDVINPAFDSDFEHYHAVVRPGLLGEQADDGALWLSIEGNRLTPDGWYQAVTRRTMDAFGIEIFPHMLRKVAASEITVGGEPTLDLAKSRLANSSSRVVGKRYVARRADLAAAKVATAREQYWRSEASKRPL